MVQNRASQELIPDRYGFLVPPPGVVPWRGLGVRRHSMSDKPDFIYFPFTYNDDGTPKDIDWFANGSNGFNSERHVALYNDTSIDCLANFESVFVAMCRKTVKAPPKSHIKYIKTSYNPNFKVGDIWFELFSVSIISIHDDELPRGMFRLPLVGDLTGYNNFNKLY